MTTVFTSLFHTLSISPTSLFSSTLLPHSHSPNPSSNCELSHFPTPSSPSTTLSLFSFRCTQYFPVSHTPHNPGLIAISDRSLLAVSNPPLTPRATISHEHYFPVLTENYYALRNSHRQPRHCFYPQARPLVARIPPSPNTRVSHTSNVFSWFTHSRHSRSHTNHRYCFSVAHNVHSASSAFRCEFGIFISMLIPSSSALLFHTFFIALISPPSVMDFFLSVSSLTQCRLQLLACQQLPLR